MSERQNVKDLPGYKVWIGIKDRCYNERGRDYKRYGARGIECLLDYEEFCDLYFRSDQCECCGASFEESQRTIDRINNDGHYEVSNCQVICRGCNSSKARKQEVGKFTGENARYRKLTQDEVDRIRKIYKRLKSRKKKKKKRIPLQKILADKFGITQSGISAIVLGKAWKNHEE